LWILRSLFVMLFGDRLSIPWLLVGRFAKSLLRRLGRFNSPGKNPWRVSRDSLYDSLITSQLPAPSWSDLASSTTLRRALSWFAHSLRSFRLIWKEPCSVGGVE
jgi:hypothetical protein